jgi:hypothetical protein
LPQCFVAVLFQATQQSSWSGGETHCWAIMALVA